MTAATEKKVTDATSSIPAFVIEADHPRNSTLLIQAVPGIRLRSALSSSRTVTDMHSGEEMVPVDQAQGLGSFPPMPGMQLAVNPAKCEVAVYDPLEDNEDLLDKFNRRLKARYGSASGVKPVPSQVVKCDTHQMKTLVRECLWLLQAGEAKLVKGPRFSMEEVDELPGRYLLNPGAQIANMQPRYEDEMAEWTSNLNRMGG